MTFNYQDVHNDRHIGAGSGAVCEPEDVAYINAMVAKAEALWPEIKPHFESLVGKEIYTMLQNELEQARMYGPGNSPRQMYGDVWALCEVLSQLSGSPSYLRGFEVSGASYDLIDKYQEFMLYCHKAMCCDKAVWGPEM